jgi:hypothetical protein
VIETNIGIESVSQKKLRCPVLSLIIHFVTHFLLFLTLVYILQFFGVKVRGNAGP